MSLVPCVKLNNGLEMPIFGLGTGSWGKANPGDATEIVKDAIDAGYRHFDGAHIYGNEVEIGVGLKAKINEGVVKREDLFIVSKLWNDCHRPDLVVPALKRTLADLQLEYVDLYLIHWPVAFKENGNVLGLDENGKTVFSEADYVDTWKVMEDCVKLGLTKSIGVSNFNSQQLERILAMCKIKPVTNQIECHPYINQKQLIEFCKSKEIFVTGYSPLGSADSPTAQSMPLKLLDDPKLIELAKKYNKSTAQIVLRWAVQLGVITIPKTVKKERAIANIEVFEFTLDDEDMKCVNSLNRNQRYCKFDEWKDSKHYPFSIDF